MRKTLWAAVAAAVLCLTAPDVGRAGLITFDEQFSGGLPVAVSYSGLVSSPYGGPTALTDAYASALGVHFSGSSAGSGGVIINDPPNYSPYGGVDYYGFGVLPHSGGNVLAFNANATVGYSYSYPWGGGGFTPTGTASGPETISFDNLQSSVSIWAAGGSLSRKFQLQAFDGKGNLLATDTLTTQDWSQLTVSASGIDHVVVTELGHTWDSWLLDDLSFTPDASVQVNGNGGRAPEPASLVLIGLGGAALAGWRWRPWRRARAA